MRIISWIALRAALIRRLDCPDPWIRERNTVGFLQSAAAVIAARFAFDRKSCVKP
jgi:hypothetical protein